MKVVRSALLTGRYSFLLEVESTLGPECDRKDNVNEKFHLCYRESNPRTSGVWGENVRTIKKFKEAVPVASKRIDPEVFAEETNHMFLYRE